MNATAQTGNRADHEASGHNGIELFSGPTGHGDNASHDANTPAWVSSACLSEHHEADVQSPIYNVVSDELWDALTAWADTRGIPLDEATTFDQFHAMPAAIYAEHIGSVPDLDAQRAAMQWVADTTGVELYDPDEWGVGFTTAAAQERKAKAGTDIRCPLSSIAAVANGEAPPLWAVRATEKAQADNLDRGVRNKTHSFTHNELLAFGATTDDIAMLTPITTETRLASLRLLKEWEAVEVQLARDNARIGEFTPLALSAGVLSFAQLSQLEPVTPLIDGLLAKGELAELIGEPGTAKTFIALGMALSMAAGRDWCGHNVPRPASTLYVLAEGASDIEVRANAFCERHRISATELDDRFHLFPRPVQITNESHISEVRSYVTEHGIDAVVFDTKARCTVGVEENSATDQGRAIANVETVNERCGAAVLMVHHTAKGSDTARGSTAWLGAVWSSLLVSRTTKDRKKTSAVSITCAKHKGWPDGCSHRFTLAPVTVTEDAMPGKNLVQRQSLAVVAVDAVAEAVAQAKDDSEIGIKIKAVFHSYGATTGLTKAEARKHARDEGVTDSSYSRYFDTFVKGKVLVPMPGASAHYRLASDAAVSTVGTEENQVLVDALKGRMCELAATGEINAAHTRSDVANMLGTPDKTAFGQAWGWFEDQGRPTART